MKTQKFGIEIELTGITRKDAAKVSAKFYGTTESYKGECTCNTKYLQMMVENSK